jgi:hypothetical protein
MLPACESGGSVVPDTSLLDPDETASPPTENDALERFNELRPDFRVTPILKEEADFRHSAWKLHRNRVWDSLLRTGQSASRLDRFHNCGSGCTVEWSPDRKEWRLSANYCRDRTCQPCGVARSRQVEAALRSFIENRHLRFATLTLKHTPHLTLPEQLKRLYTSFSTLRRRTWWKDKVKGGVAILEVKIGRDGLWHPHLHLLLESFFLPQKQLSHEWLAVTGDSYIVDVRQVGQEQQEVRYVCSYVGKPLDASIYQRPTMLDEFVRAIKGKRLILPFGTWAKLNLDSESDDPGGWVCVGPLWRLIQDASTDPQAQIILNLLQRRSVRSNEHSISSPPPAPP